MDTGFRTLGGHVVTVPVAQLEKVRMLLAVKEGGMSNDAAAVGRVHKRGLAEKDTADNVPGPSSKQQTPGMATSVEVPAPDESPRKRLKTDTNEEPAGRVNTSQSGVSSWGSVDDDVEFAMLADLTESALRIAGNAEDTGRDMNDEDDHYFLEVPENIASGEQQ